MQAKPLSTYFSSNMKHTWTYPAVVLHVARALDHLRTVEAGRVGVERHHGLARAELGVGVQVRGAVFRRVGVGKGDDGAEGCIVASASMIDK